MFSPDQIRTKLASIEPRTLEIGSNREAAVLIPVFELEGEPHFLLTRRTDAVETHKGQISFPGGMRHAGESLERTALRETFEEVGIQSDQIRILGRFHDYYSSTGYLVSPFAGHIAAPFTVVPQVSEVAEVLQVPLRIFLDPERLRVERMQKLGDMVDVYFYSYSFHQIWGLTARIIHDLLEELQR
jgi:8-oxo-dGTP pyrophosphatase MutT (NUDIX family)